MKTGNIYTSRAVIISQNEEARICMQKSTLICDKPIFCQMRKQIYI